MLTCHAARQHEDGDIGTADKQEQEYGAEEHEQRALKVSEDLLVEGHNGHLRSLRKVGGILPCVTVDEGLQLSDETFVSYTRLDFDEGQHVIVRIRFEVAGYVHIAVTPGKAGIGYADDGVEGVIELDRFAAIHRLGNVLTLPEVSFEHSDRNR